MAREGRREGGTDPKIHQERKKERREKMNFDTHQPFGVTDASLRPEVFGYSEVALCSVLLQLSNRRGCCQTGLNEFLICVYNLIQHSNL